jgi:hypothetical protein
MTKISDLPLAPTLFDEDTIPVVQGGVTKKASVDQLFQFAETGAALDRLEQQDGSELVGFLQSGTGATTRTTQAKLRDMVSVRDFGAVGDGAANDSAAIQAAIDYLAGLGGGVLFFPRGRYKCNVILKSNVTLTSLATGAYGYLPNSLRNVTLEQAGAGFVVDTPSSSVYAASVVGINFQGGGAGVAGGGIRFRDVAWGAVKQCQFDQFADQAILKEGGEACAFEDILTTNVLLNRTRSTQNGCIELAGGADDILSRVEANPSLGSSVSDANLRVCAFVIRAANVFVSNCVGEFADYGYYTTGAYCRFVNCRADLNRGHGFHCGGASQYTNCTSLSNGQAAAGTYDGFRAMGQGDSFSNCVSRNISSTVRYAFYDPANFGAVTSRNTYFNCQASEFTLGKFFLEGFAGSSPVEPGTPAFSDTATPDTTGTTFIVLTHASATTVTDFLGGFSGKTVRFLGNANVTIQHGTNIFTNTGANKVLAAQKVYTFTRYNGVWYEEA